MEMTHPDIFFSLCFHSKKNLVFVHKLPFFILVMPEACPSSQ